MSNFITGIITLSIGIAILSGVFITTVKGVNQSYTCYNSSGAAIQCNWATSEIALFGLLTIVAMAGMVYGILNVFGIA